MNISPYMYELCNQSLVVVFCFNVAKYNLGKVNVKPMQVHSKPMRSADFPISVRDMMWGSLRALLLAHLLAWHFAGL